MFTKYFKTSAYTTRCNRAGAGVGIEKTKRSGYSSGEVKNKEEIVKI